MSYASIEVTKEAINRKENTDRNQNRRKQRQGREIKLIKGWSSRTYHTKFALLPTGATDAHKVKTYGVFFVCQLL